MSTKPPPEDWQKDAETLFRAMDGLDQVLDPTNVVKKKVGFQEIYAYTHNPAHQPSPELDFALKNDLNVRRDIRALLQKQNIVDMGMAVAASSGDINEREANGFKITLKPTQANPDQVYLIIEALDRDEIPHLLFVDTDDGFYRLEIEDFYDGQAQMILEIHDPIVKALHNPKSRVILS